MAAIRRRIYLDHDRDGRRVVVQHTSQDVEDILRRNRALFNAERGTTALRPGDEWRHVASIPLAVVESWGKRGAWLWESNDWRIIRRMLNDSEWQSLRTAPGRI